MFVIFNSLVHFGLGRVNTGKDGRPKHISIGMGDERSLVSGQKIRHGGRNGLRKAGFKMSVHTRMLLDEMVELALTKTEKAASDKTAAAIFCKAVLVKFLGHSTKKDTKKKDAPEKTAEEIAAAAALEKEEENIEITSYSRREYDSLRQIASDRGAGKKVDIDKLDLVFTNVLEQLTDDDIELDLFLRGRMRPTKITGALKAGAILGITPCSDERDFLRAMDDLVDTRVSDKGSAHCGERKWYGTFTGYGCQVLDIDALSRYYKGDKAKINKALQACLDNVIQHAPKSDSVDCPANQGETLYVQVIKTDKPFSLEVAFQNPVGTPQDGIKALKEYYDAREAAYKEEAEEGTANAYVPNTCADWTTLPNITAGSLKDLKKFVSI